MNKKSSHDLMNRNEKVSLVPVYLLWPFILLTSLFMWWGVANNMTDTLLPAFKRIMTMNDARTALIQVVCYGAGYALFAIPAAIYIKKNSYKAGVLLGLGLYAIGALLFFPAKLTANYYCFLGAIWILFGGLSILETAANPYIIAMGPEATETRRLNLAQSFNSLGAILGVIISQLFILSKLNSAGAQDRAAMGSIELQAIQNKELNAVTMTYVAVGLILVVTWMMIAVNKKMPKSSEAGGPLNLRPTFKRLLHNRQYVWGVVAQFFYVGAQIGVWSFTIRYVQKELCLVEKIYPLKWTLFFPGILQTILGKQSIEFFFTTSEQLAATFYMGSLIVFAISRFICTWLMRYIKPANLITGLSVIAIMLNILVIHPGEPIGVGALIGISGCMSLMFPTIFGLACRGLGEDKKLGGSGLIMAILGGAVLTQIEGVVSDVTENIRLAYCVPLIAFIVISYYGAFACRKPFSRQNHA